MSCGSVQDANSHYGIPYANMHTQADSYWQADAAGHWCTIYTRSGDRVDAGASGYNGNYILMDSSSNPANIISLVPVPPPPTCLTGETSILMVDGSEKRIDQVRQGDYVLGPSGEARRVTDVEAPLLGSRLLYAINNSDAFITAEHPVMTGEGWKAIDPAATAAENPNLSVGRFAIGDEVMMLRSSIDRAASMPGASLLVKLRLTAVPVVRVEPFRADPSLRLYNLQLESDHAYFANRILVHNKGH